MAKKKPKKQAAAPRSLYVIAAEIRQAWPNMYYGAVPYVRAMGQMATMQDMYGSEDATSIILYFLANATSWRGPDAKRVKAELNAMVKDARKQRGNPGRRWKGLSPIQRKVYDYIQSAESPRAIDQGALAEVRAMGEAGAQAYWEERLEPSAVEAAAATRQFVAGPKRNASGRAAPQWNPIESELYSVTIWPRPSPSLERAGAAAVKVLKSLRLWHRAQYVELPGTIRIEGLKFDQFRDLIVALEHRGFSGMVNVDGQVEVIFEEVAKRGATIKRARKKLRKAFKGGSAEATERAKRALRSAMRGT